MSATERAAHEPAYQAGHDWRTVKSINDTYDIPAVLKAIATVEDARIRVDHGVDGIYVPDHGGPQRDHGRDAMNVLPEIAGALAGRAKVYPAAPVTIPSGLSAFPLWVCRAPKTLDISRVKRGFAIYTEIPYDCSP
ncbi:hypothetical protein FJ937_26805 [Mesorhizobium sp. B2-4-4]|nr:hypothetical protein FJ937_26805 [Mesorhizobium sp. B2-4-4]